jgi:ribosomal protein L7/L12
MGFGKDYEWRGDNELQKALNAAGLDVFAGEALLALDNKIQGIKAHRARTGVSLRASKSAVEKAMDVAKLNQRNS